MALQNAFGDLALDATLVTTNGKLDDILAELNGKLNAGGTVALDAATLAALETITVANADFPDAAVLAKLELIRLLLAGTLTVTGTVTANTGLTQPLTDAQLRATSVPVSGPLTDTQLRATPVPISGTVTASTGLTQPLTDTQLRATPVPVSGTVTASGPLTDTQLRATPVPVSGTVTANTGLTQPLTDTQLRATAVPISAASLPLPSGAALETGGNLTTLVARTPALGQAAMASSRPVALATENVQDIPITGQSGQTALGNNILLAVAGTGSIDTISQSGQSARSIHVSIIPSGTIAGGIITFEGSDDNFATAAGLMYLYDDNLNNGTTVATCTLATGTNRFFSGPTRYRYVRLRISTVVSGSGGSVQAISKFSTVPYVPIVQCVAQPSSLLIVQPPSITKGTQAGQGFTVQPLRDAGRVAVRFSANGIAAGTTGTETAITLVKSADNGATSSAASFVITSAKRFRIQAIMVASRGNATATPQITTFNLRINTAGAVTTSSTPIILSLRSATIAGSEYDRVYLEIPDGMETLGDGTIQIGITANAVYTTNAPTWDVNIIGFEY